ncbi:hypothetical protein [Aequorivita antarctica]|uniref:Gliding motility-associated protein GldM N-terminal domain-containing protein n=1 Tax=Aequorivita antarctica TaxID=153266 RepID=A0A5C6YVZ5_9FLAO|nr:hypothetical protein [Aequorivita antarctica]TXD71226.1 hypothetical protein ESU54_17575 [Aequorivita antarctica]SRX76266.1 hypothetical protein AEQU3_03265 [Aequorivita antarctica]
MKKNLFYLIAITLIACTEKQKSDSDFEKDFGMYTVLLNDIDYHAFYIEKQIEFELSNLNTPDSELQTVDSITKLYIANIDKILTEFQSDLLINDSTITDNQKILMSSDRVSEYFFKNDSVSSKGENFKKMTNEYSSELLKYVKYPIYQRRVIGGLKTDFIENRDNSKNERLSYIFYNTPLIGAITYLKLLKKNALEYEFQIVAKKTSCQHQL